MRRVAVRVARDRAEIARAQFLDLAPRGFEETERAGELELAVYTDDAGVAQIRRLYPSATSTPVEPGWDERWREFHRPVRAGGLWIGPPWEVPPAGETVVVIEPGRAFGTGAHPTTRGCIELLAAQVRGSVLDVGCGSGVVAVAARQLGFGPVLAVDLDPVAVAVTRENAVRNGVEVETLLLDALRDELPQADLVVANIERGAVEALLPRCRAPRAIASGYLAGELPAVPGWELGNELVLEGWAATVFVAS